jgi:Flp pilus assembly pilin Flp
MRLGYWRFVARLQCLLNGVTGQSMVEYTLLVAVLSLAAVASMDQLAASINAVFDSMSTVLNTAF